MDDTLLETRQPRKFSNQDFIRLLYSKIVLNGYNIVIIVRELVIRLCQVGVRNKQNLYPRIPTTDVAKLLQYSGSRVEHRDGFSS